MSMGTSLRSYYRGHSLVSMRDGQAGASRYYHFDAQGTTQCLTDASGAVTDRFAADAWGVQIKRTGISINRHWYIGNLGYQRAASAGDYVRRRQLQPLSGTWLTRDPSRHPAVGEYRYAEGSPAQWTDPSGLKVIKVPPDVPWPGRPFVPTKDFPGSTRCNADLGKMVTTYDDRWCDFQVLEGHERLHRQHAEQCCQNYSKCIKAAGNNIKQYFKCSDANIDFYLNSGFRDWTECLAWTYSYIYLSWLVGTCREDRAAGRECDRYCCDEFEDYLKSAKKKMDGHCGKAPATEPPCPFDKDGRITK